MLRREDVQRRDARPSARQLERLLTTEELAELLQVSIRTIEGWAYRGVGPRVTKIGSNRRYRPADVAAFLDAGRRRRADR